MRYSTVILVLMMAVGSELGAAKVKVNGVYTAWGQSQHAFTFNAEKYNHNYVVQMLRFKVIGWAIEDVKFVTRLDLAQGWWGVDNMLKSKYRTGQSGGSALFDFKETNFLLHVDQAYIVFDLPTLPITARVGRMWYGLGYKLMVDNNYDGVQLDIKNVLGKKLTLYWAKVSEGVDGLSDQDSVAPDARGFWDARDAHLFMANLNLAFGSLKTNLYGFFYRDWSIKDKNAYIPDHLQFFKTRFSPQVTQLSAIGVSGIYKNGPLSVKFEGDYLTGKYEIEDTTHHPKQLWDINDGTLSGFNVYLNASYTVNDALSLGIVAGMGSGDDDLTGGKGNVNKLRTSGFFYITEIWEDSIMPDEEGITPQGLGAPNVRAYRELENTTIFQVNTTIKPIPKWSLFLSYSYIRATQPIHAWMPVLDTLGNVVDAQIDPNISSKDLGQEIDFKLSHKMYKQLDLTLRGGYFMPGDAVLYLVNGNKDVNDPAWELKLTVTYKF